MKARALLHRLAADTRGATAVEFAAIAPILLMVLMGFMELSYNIYAASLLEGSIQKAGRDGTLEGAEARGLAIDDRVRETVLDIVPDATVTFDRRAYIDYSNVERAERFTDLDDDGNCNGGEPFEDMNGNGRWDQDGGRADMGGARDAVLYTVTVSYPRAFPVFGLIGMSDTVTTSSRTVLRNQPYGPQNRASAVGNCP